MPNRRRRKLSTAMSAVAALAIASPCAYFLVYESTAGAKPAPEHHEFKQAAAITDLPGEVVSALSQGLSQFGINMPPVPALTGTGDAGNGLGTPGLTSPGTPGLTAPNTGLGTPGLTAPGTGLTNPALTNPALTSPTGLAPGQTSPTGLNPLGTTPGEVPITAPASLDPGADGTYPILGDPSTLGGTSPISPIGTGNGGTNAGGGLVNDFIQAANQLGVNQVVDLLKGVLMPAIMQGVQNGGAAGGLPGAVAPPAPALVPVT